MTTQLSLDLPKPPTLTQLLYDLEKKAKARRYDGQLKNIREAVDRVVETHREIKEVL